MRLNVRLGEPLWRSVGVRRLVLEWPQGREVTVDDALERLATDYPSFGTAFGKAGSLHPMPYRVFVDAVAVEPAPDAGAGRGTEREGSGVGTMLADGQTLFILLPAIGG